jgi:hypothetical protein
MPYALLRESLMPRVVGLCLRTTSLVVRTSALALMAQAAHRLDKEAAGAMLDVCSQVSGFGVRAVILSYIADRQVEASCTCVRGAVLGCDERMCGY